MNVLKQLGKKIAAGVVLLHHELRHLPLKCYAWALNVSVPRASYDLLTEDNLKDRCRGDTLFVLGSGASLARLSPSQIQIMSKHTTISFNYTAIQAFIPVDFHVVREILLTANGRKTKAGLSELGTLLSTNPCYQQTVFLIQGGFGAWGGNLFFGGQHLKARPAVFRYFNAKPYGNVPLRATFRDGISHGASTVTDCINIGTILGFRHIVLCGVDLYDRKYFWHVPGVCVMPMPSVTEGLDEEYSGRAVGEEQHRTGRRLIEQIARWNEDLTNMGVTLWIQNPQSLLAKVLPVYRFPKSD